MRSLAVQSVPAFVPAALAASQVGTWETYANADLIITDAVTARLFGLDPEEAAAGLPIAHYQDRVHDEDRPLTLQRYARVRIEGGTYVFEYRTTPSLGEVRWALVRGHYDRDPATGAMVGRGVIIDITASKLDGHVEDKAMFLRAPDTSAEPLDEAAAHAIAAREAIDRIEGAGWSELRKAVDALLWAVGRALARRG